MDQSTTVVDIDFGMSQLSGNKKLLFTLLGKFTDEYRSLDADLQAHVAKGDFNEAYSLVHTLKGVTGNLGLFALHNASKPVESGFRNDKRVAEQYPAFIAVLDETIAAVDALIKEPEVTASAPAPAKASEFIAQDKLDEWLDALALPQEKRSAIIDAVDELDYEEAISELENS